MGTHRAYQHWRDLLDPCLRVHSRFQVKSGALLNTPKWGGASAGALGNGGGGGQR
jgi:hypothetical protein